MKSPGPSVPQTLLDFRRWRDLQGRLARILLYYPTSGHRRLSERRQRWGCKEEVMDLASTNLLVTPIIGSVVGRLGTATG